MYLWQTFAWSGGRIAPEIDLYQGPQITVGGVDCDGDTAYTDAWLWSIGGTVPAVPVWPGRYLKLGTPRMTGQDIESWQARLSQLQIAPLLTDGIFGLETDKATRAFQSKKDLLADGVVGPNTWAAAWA
jgi:peptidoglycan hydrolase-like protein with peptidoglycan-binding domain